MTTFDPTENIDIEVSPRFNGEQVEDGKGWKHYAWDVKLVSKTYPKTLLYTPYKTGVGIGEYYRFGSKKPVPRDQYKIAPNGTAWRNGSGSALEFRPSTPTVKDVLSSLIMDAEAGDYSHHDFCMVFGYEEDSISALEIYNACVAMAPKVWELLRATHVDIEQAKEWAMEQ